jgi:hypothetical protein
MYDELKRIGEEAVIDCFLAFAWRIRKEVGRQEKSLFRLIVFHLKFETGPAPHSPLVSVQISCIYTKLYLLNDCFKVVNQHFCL